MKKCKITNGKFSWLLEVDGKVIIFFGRENAEYFADHYNKLEYNVEIVEIKEEEAL